MKTPHWDDLRDEIDHPFNEGLRNLHDQKRLDRLNAHVERMARICAIGDACCRAIEALQPAVPAKGGSHEHDPTLESFFQDTFIKTVLGSTVEHTRYKYRASVRHADNFAQRKVRISELCDAFILSLSAQLTKGGMSEGMVRTHRQHLRTIAAEAQKQGFKTGWISTIDPLANNVGGNRRQKFKRDLRGPKGRTRRLLAKAASLFAGGHTFEAIAERLGVAAETIHTWRGRYRAVWDAAYKSATHAVIESVRKEGAKRCELIREAAYLRRAWAAERALAQQGETLVQDTEPATGKRLSEMLADLAAERNWGEGNVRQYAATLRLLERWSGRTMYCCEFAATWVNDFLLEVENSAFASATKRSRRMMIVAMWRAAYDADLCAAPPAKIRRFKFVRKAPEAWLHEEVERLVGQAATIRGSYDVVDESSGRTRQVARAAWWRMVIRVLWDTGLRPGDALQLTADDVSSDGVLQLTQGKTGQWHVCRFHPSTMATLAELKPAKGERILPWAKTSNFLRTEWFYRIIDPLEMRGSVKKLRKSSASDVELHHPGMGGVHLGHRTSVGIAHNHYLDPRIVAKNRPMPTELTADVRRAQSA